MNHELTSGTGLIGRWGLNEGSGTTTAGSVGPVNGTLTAGTSWVAGAPPIEPPPPTRSGISSTGLGSHVDLGAGSRSLGATNFTLELWFKRTGTGSRDQHRLRAAHVRHPADHEGPLGERRRRTSTSTTSWGSTAPPNRLAADFEEGAGRTTRGRTTASRRTTVIPMNVWTTPP